MIDTQQLNKRIEELEKKINYKDRCETCEHKFSDHEINEDGSYGECTNCHYCLKYVNHYYLSPLYKHELEAELKILNEWKQDKESMLQKIDDLITFIISLDVKSKAETNIKLKIINKIKELLKYDE